MPQSYEEKNSIIPIRDKSGDYPADVIQSPSHDSKTPDDAKEAFDRICEDKQLMEDLKDPLDEI